MRNKVARCFVAALLAVAIPGVSFGYLATFGSWQANRDSSTNYAKYLIEYARVPASEIGEQVVPEHLAILLNNRSWTRLWADSISDTTIGNSVRNGIYKTIQRGKKRTKKAITKPFFDDLVYSRYIGKPLELFIDVAPSTLPLTVVDVDNRSSHWLFGDAMTSYVIVDSDSQRLLAASWPESVSGQTYVHWQLVYDGQYSSPSRVRYTRFQADDASFGVGLNGAYVAQGTTITRDAILTRFDYQRVGTPERISDQRAKDLRTSWRPSQPDTLQ